MHHAEITEKRRREHAEDPSAGKTGGGTDRRGRSGGQALLRHKGAGGERRGCRRFHHHRGDPPGRHHLYAGHRQRLRHPARGCSHGLSAPRHQQGGPAGRPELHLHPGLPGRGAGVHFRCLPCGGAHPGPGGCKRGALHRGRLGGLHPGGGGLSGGHHHSGAGPVLQHSRPDEVPEKGRHRRQLRGGDSGQACPVPPGDLLSVHPGRQRAASHPWGREAVLHHLRSVRQGVFLHADSRGLRAGPREGGGVHQRPRLQPAQQDHAELFHQRPVYPQPHGHGRPGGGLQGLHYGGEISRLRAAHEALLRRCGCKRPPCQAGGALCQRAAYFRRGVPRGEVGAPRGGQAQGDGTETPLGFALCAETGKTGAASPYGAAQAGCSPKEGGRPRSCVQSPQLFRIHPEGQRRFPANSRVFRLFGTGAGERARTGAAQSGPAGRGEAAFPERGASRGGACSGGGTCPGGETCTGGAAASFGGVSFPHHWGGLWHLPGGGIQQPGADVHRQARCPRTAALRAAETGKRGGRSPDLAGACHRHPGQGGVHRRAGPPGRVLQGRL